jgi:hypothetical protein
MSQRSESRRHLVRGSVSVELASWKTCRRGLVRGDVSLESSLGRQFIFMPPGGAKREGGESPLVSQDYMVVPICPSILPQDRKIP